MASLTLCIRQDIYRSQCYRRISPRPTSPLYKGGGEVKEKGNALLLGGVLATPLSKDRLEWERHKRRTSLHKFAIFWEEVGTNAHSIIRLHVARPRNDWLMFFFKWIVLKDCFHCSSNINVFYINLFNFYVIVYHSDLSVLFLLYHQISLSRAWTIVHDHWKI